MKKSRQKIAAIIAFACILNLSQSISTSAGISIRPTGDSATGENQAVQHGYRVIDIENWSPADDPYSENLRAQVPLQERIEPLSETQANPNLKSEASLTNLSGDYGNAPIDSVAYTNEFSQYAYNFWQYTDIYASWHGMGTEGIPESLYNDEFEFEFGILNLPNPAYTNAAHKNGVKSLGCLFIPRGGQPYDELLKKDENGEYIVAKKLIEIMEYFGFDGYFINQETSIDSEHIVPYKEFTKTLVDAGVYTQWYDCIDDEAGKLTYKPKLIPSHSSFVYDTKTDLGRVNSSIFMNYNWNSFNGWDNGDSDNPEYIDATVEEANRIGINPLDSVLMGVEVGMGKFDGSHNSTRNMDVILDETGNPKAGIAMLGADYVMTGLDDDLGDSTQEKRGDDNYQWMIAERERMFYTGVTIDPLDTGEKEGYSREDVGLKDASQWGGVSRYISERSVINGSVFATNFNTGHGMNYYKDGVVSNNEEWSNMNLQDILPTWQWWIDTSGSKLQVDFDYGAEIDNGEKFNYTQIGGFKGGSSLVVNGDLDSENYLRLFKTELDVNSSSKLSITYNKTSGDNAEEISVGLIFKDNPEKVEYISVENSNKNTNAWVTSTLDISQFKGREIAVIGLGFNSEDGKVSQGYQVNIGEIKITDNKNHTPKKPSGFKVVEYLNTNEVYLEWNLGDYDEVEQYNVYAKNENGEAIYLGGIYDDNYYIKNLPSDTVELLLTAEGFDGSESNPVSIDVSNEYKVKELEVDEQEESLNIKWINPESKYKNIKVEVILEEKDIVYSGVLDGKTNYIEVPIEKGEGRKYKVNVSTMQNKNKILDTVSASGKTKDTYSEKYIGEINVVTVNGEERLLLESPKSKDWWKMVVRIKDEIYEYERGISGDYSNITKPQSGEVIEVYIIDYDGNVSETVEMNI